MKKKERESKKNIPAKRSLREEWELIARALKIWNELLPGYFLCQFLRIVFEVFAPYFGLFMSAELINGLAEGRGMRQLLFLAVVTAAGTFVISLVSRFLQGKCTVMEAFTMEQHEEYVAAKQNEHSFEHTENPDVVLLRSKIRNDFVSFGGGLYSLRWTFFGLVRELFNVVFSVSLTVSMFSVAAKGNFSGFLGFINSPFSAAAIILLIAGNTWLSVRISAVSTEKNQKELSGLSASNARFSVYSQLWSRDMILFNLHRIVLEDIKKFQVHPEWVTKIEQIQIRYGILSVLLDAVLNIAIFIFVAAKAFTGVFGIGSFVLYQGTVGRFIHAVSNIGTVIGRLRYNNNFLVEFYRYLDLPRNMYQGSLAVEKRDDIEYEIEFQDVGFQYPRTENWALRHVDMKFRIGDKLAIVGENGSGKTTFIKLLCRLYDPTEGRILLNGIDITKYRYQEYMELFSVVFQDYSLFEFPLGENVAAGLDYDAARVRNCLKRVGLGEKLAELDAAAEAEAAGSGQTEEKAAAGGRSKDTGGRNKNTGGRRGGSTAAECRPGVLERAIGRGYDSEGIDFSGGEEQKIALARALYKDAPFVILDEPTAALDPLAEAAVYETFDGIVKDKTSVFISHRLSSCRFCDTIAVFDHGQIVQRGSHDELAAQKEGKYFQLWTAQAKYYTEQEG